MEWKISDFMFLSLAVAFGLIIFSTLAYLTLHILTDQGFKAMQLKNSDDEPKLEDISDLESIDESDDEEEELDDL